VGQWRGRGKVFLLRVEVRCMRFFCLCRPRWVRKPHSLRGPEGDGWEGKEELVQIEARSPFSFPSFSPPNPLHGMNDPIVTPWSPYPPSQPSQPPPPTHLDNGPLPPRTSPPPPPPPISPEDVPRPRGSSTSSPRRPGLPNRNTSSSYKSDIQDNFRHSISISIPAPVGSMSISPANRE